MTRCPLCAWAMLWKLVCHGAITAVRVIPGDNGMYAHLVCGSRFPSVETWRGPNIGKRVASWKDLLPERTAMH